MKKIACLPLLLILCISACKKEKDCVINAHKAPCYVAFYGFKTTDVDTIMLLRYEQGSGFTKLIATDLLSFPNPWKAPDSTTFSSSSRSHMGALSANADYEVQIPALSRAYRITNITYQSDTVVHYTTKQDCGSFGVNTVYPQTVFVDNNYTATGTISFNDTRWIVLSR